MNNQNSVVNTEPKVQPKVQPKSQSRPKKMPPQQSQIPGGPEIWDGNNAGWTLVSYSKKKSKK